jgi:hypothetical protein
MPRRASRLPTAMLVSCRLVRYITPASVPSPLDPGAGLWMEFFGPAARCWGSARAPSQSDEKFGRSSAGRAYGQLSPSFNDGSEIAVHKSSRKSRRRNRPQDRIFKQEGVLTLTPDQVKIVQDSFQKVVPIAATAADLFCDQLFAISPEVRPLVS